MEYLHDANHYAEWLIKSGEVENIATRRKFILKNFQCPGDLLMLSACVRDIKLWYPFLDIDVRTSCDDIWNNNPNLTPMNEDEPLVACLDMQYEIIHKSNENIHAHFIHGFIDDFNRQTGFAVKLTAFQPDVYLTDDEKNTPVFEDQPEEFVVFIAGGKTDYKTKWWWKEKWTDVIDCAKDIQFVQVGRVDADNHVHDEIKRDNVINKLGQTTVRQLLRLVYQSKGTLSVVTALMHMAAAFGRHAAVIAGGHEPWWWERYPGHDYFHTIGKLPCCSDGGCWKGECENQNDKGHDDRV